jgi:hypothetical protein
MKDDDAYEKMKGQNKLSEHVFPLTLESFLVWMVKNEGEFRVVKNTTNMSHRVYLSIGSGYKVLNISQEFSTRRLEAVKVDERNKIFLHTLSKFIHTLEHPERIERANNQKAINQEEKEIAQEKRKKEKRKCY